MATGRAVEGFLKRDRLVVLAGLVVVTALAWVYLMSLAAGMDDMGGVMSAMGRLGPWTAVDAVLMFVMWAVMMIGMMVPSATPVILLYGLVCRRRGVGGRALAPTGAFFAGYVTVWTVFSVVATAMQWGLERAALLSPMMVSTSPLFSGIVLIAAGLYQWTPYKDACLRRCRSPVEFLSTHWRDGALGAFVMGLEHGAYCLGCCWVLMALLFFGGVMNLLWVAAITVFVLVEKVAPFGRLVGRAGAGLLVLSGVAIIAIV
ncbi:MAG: DUF2182 domain-containing protein [Nitrospinota bacterium]